LKTLNPTDKPTEICSSPPPDSTSTSPESSYSTRPLDNLIPTENLSFKSLLIKTSLPELRLIKDYKFYLEPKTRPGPLDSTHLPRDAKNITEWELDLPNGELS